ncbi:MAG TPA: DinB family protein [Chthonomonadaceae bacterium]|nr:DinB family protein [Chthonomonadaceae bacterium]
MSEENHLRGNNQPPTIQSVAASLTEKAASDLIAVAQATPEDKATWQPFADVRPMLEQLVECCLANRMWTNILQTHVHAVLPEGVAAQAYKELDTIAKATAHLQETSHRLAEVIRNIPDADLPVIVPFPWKLEAGKPLAECCLHPYWNMSVRRAS